MSSLRSIVYVSSAVHELGAGELEALLTKARSENLRHGVTGVLFYNGGNFMQCIEGPSASIPHVYGRIRESRLHHNMLVLMDEPVSRRNFDGWEMALVEPTRSELLALSTARWKAQAGTRASAIGGDGWRLMNALWNSASG